MTVKTVAEYGSRLVKMQAYFDQNNIDYKVYENKSGIMCISIFFDNAEEERKAQTYETDLIIQEKIDSKMVYDNIKDLRMASKMTQQGFGDYFGVPIRTVQSWELGERECKSFIIELMEFKLRKNGLIK